MQQSEIVRGSTYLCKGNWLRRVLDIRKITGDYSSVHYVVLRDGRTGAKQSGPLEWFANNALREIGEKP